LRGISRFEREKADVPIEERLCDPGTRRERIAADRHIPAQTGRSGDEHSKRPNARARFAAHGDVTRSAWFRRIQHIGERRVDRSILKNDAEGSAAARRSRRRCTHCMVGVLCRQLDAVGVQKPRGLGQQALRAEGRDARGRQHGVHLEQPLAVERAVIDKWMKKWMAEPRVNRASLGPAKLGAALFR
jgi:hypothetical protein